MSLHCKRHKSKVSLDNCLEDRRIINEPDAINHAPSIRVKETCAISRSCSLDSFTAASPLIRPLRCGILFLGFRT